jgi:hypothetical protein
MAYLGESPRGPKRDVADSLRRLAEAYGVDDEAVYGWDEPDVDTDPVEIAVQARLDEMIDDDDEGEFDALTETYERSVDGLGSAARERAAESRLEELLESMGIDSGPRERKPRGFLGEDADDYDGFDDDDF